MIENSSPISRRLFRRFGCAVCMTIAASAAQAAPAAVVQPSVRSAGGVVFPSGFFGTRANALDQVDEIVAAADQTLKAAGVREGIGAMAQHTIYVKNGALNPLDVLTRFHAVARRLSPSLLDHPSVGTILRVPGFEDPRSVVGLDLSAAPPGTAAELSRVRFKFGPQEIGQSIADDRFVFSAGLEAFDFEHGTLVPTIEQQVDVVTSKLLKVMADAGVSVAQMVSHNLYVAKGSDPLKVAGLFHESLHAKLPQLAAAQSVGTLVVVDGMAAPGFLLEMDAIATRGDPAAVRRVPYDEPLPVAKAAAVGGLVFTSSIDALPQSPADAIPTGALQQARVIAQRTAAAVMKAGMPASRLAKVKLYVRAGNPVGAVRSAFLSALRAAGAGHPAVTVIVVEALEAPALECAATAVAGEQIPGVGR
jgi:enamine deaminase RidA (YjgF/YER057c/UK114 family)